MGNRVWTVISSNDFDGKDIGIYQHWFGDKNLAVVKEVLEVTGRIGDASYLTAAIISALMNASDYDGRESFGISPVDKWDVQYDNWGDNPTLYVDADTGNYTYEDVTYDRWGKQLDPMLDDEE